MAWVCERANGLELLIDGLEHGALAEPNLIPEWEQPRVPLFVEVGEELASLLPELREAGLGEGAPSSPQVTDQPARTLRHGRAVLAGAGSQPEGQPLPAVGKDPRDFDAGAPARAGDPARGSGLAHLRRFTAHVVPDFQGGRSTDRKARAAPPAGGEQGRQGPQGRGFSLDKARRADARGKGPGQRAAAGGEGERLAGATTLRREEPQPRPHCADAQRGVAEAVRLSLGALRGLEVRNDLPPDLVTVLEEAQEVPGALL
jgi:hypothetical protein